MKNKNNKFWIQSFLMFLLACLLISGCAINGPSNYAPISNIRNEPSTPKGHYRVKPGDTLYSIAWAYGFDYREFASMNDISSPYRLRAGKLVVVNRRYESVPAKASGMIQRLEKNYETWSKEAANEITKTPKRKVIKPKLTRPNPHWRWPTKGQIIQGYAPTKGYKGINIAGNVGDPIYAASSGNVVYSGEGLPSYGKLIIIKHNDDYLSAYAHNQKILVKEGQHVKDGQKIAMMGSTGVDQVMLHFEIRRLGKPVDPLKYLPSKNR